MSKPVRTCVGCREKGSPGAWVRIAAAPDGTLQVGRTAPGRGAWVCSIPCFDLAVKRRALSRALRREVTSTDAEALRARLESNLS
ncbi:MAG TPA: DUF448 domain-containing protein [Acidimicrobiia bacterium]|nr:DUF448 domain-containing protein [Acidimicrobiia bacterium]